MQEVSPLVNEASSYFVESFVHSLAKFTENMKESMYWFNPDNIEDCVQFSRDYSRSFDTKIDYIEAFILFFQNKLKKAYAVGLESSHQEINSLFDKGIYADDMDLKRMNLYIARHTKFVKSALAIFYNFLHDVQIDRIMSGHSVLSLFDAFISDAVRSEVERTKKIVKDMINFSLKETFNIAKLSKYKQEKIRWYVIEKNLKHKDDCNIPFDDVLMPTGVKETPFPPFAPSCTCAMTINESVVNATKKEEKKEKNRLE